MPLRHLFPRHTPAELDAFGDLGFGFFGGAVVHVVGGDGEDRAEAPESGDGFDVGCALVQGAAGWDCHSACGDVHDSSAAAEAYACVVVAVEGDPEQRGVLDECLQDSRDGHVPEGGGNHHGVGCRDCLGSFCGPFGDISRDPCRVALRVQGLYVHLGQMVGRYFILLRKRRHDGLGNPPRAGIPFPHAGIDVNQFLHTFAFPTKIGIIG